jgi:predicted dehydrogenase
MSKLRIGIAGLGGIAKRIHIPVIRSFPDIEIVAGAEKNDAQRERVRGLFDLPNVYPGYEAMIEAGGLDAVLVALPSFLHKDAVLRALDAGLHVLCEKPMGLSCDEAREMDERARAAGRVLMPAYQFRFVETFSRARAMIASGLLGRILMVESVFMNPGPYLSWDPKSDWYFRGNTNGALYDSGCHIVDITNFLLPETPAVRDARVNCVRGYRGYDVPTNISGSLKLYEDALWTIDVGWRTGAESMSVCVNGTSGMVRVGPHTLQYECRGTDPLDRVLDFLGNGWAQAWRLGKRVIRVVRGTDLPLEYRGEIEAFLRAVTDGTPPPVTAADAMTTHRVLAALAAAID